MTKDVITVDKEDTLLDLREILDTRHFHHLVVIDGVDVCGIISVNDLSRAVQPVVAVEDGMPLTDLTASDIMTSDPITIEPEHTVKDAADVILTNRLHALPVVKDGQLKGIVTSHDLLNFSFT